MPVFTNFAVYTAWYEFYYTPPDRGAAAVNFSNFRIDAGKMITATVETQSRIGGGEYPGASFSCQLVRSNPDGSDAAVTSATIPFGNHSVTGNSVEWIEERPSDENGNLWPLTNYGSVRFSKSGSIN